MLRSILVFLLLSWIKLVSHLFYRHRAEWMNGRPRGWWRPIRIIAILYHTSLYEVLLIGFAPLQLVWKIATHGVLPVAEKTIRRPVVGVFFRFLMRHVVVVTRQRDRTWDEVLNRVDTQSVVTILPEGRMMRRDGLDANGKPMTVRGGIADILLALEKGQMLLLYNQGLHHIQAPGELLPRPFKSIRARFEFVDIATYKAERMAENGGPEGFKQAVIRDLERRRDRYCPQHPRPEEPPQDVAATG